MQLPTITINNDQKLVVKRLLSGLGEVLVQRGQQVSALDIVARAELPSRYVALHVSRKLAKYGVDMSEVMLKQQGEVVEEGEVIASRKGTFGQKSVYAPTKGRIASIGPGWVLLETERTITQVQAFIDGTVTRVIANRGVIIEAMGSMVQASCGFGGEAYGLLKNMVKSPTDHMDAAEIDAHAENTILLAGQSVDEEIIRQAEAHAVRGIIVGSIDATLLKLNPAPKLCVVATDGFGDLPMSSYTFNLLRNLGGREVSIRGLTPSLTPPDPWGLAQEAPVIFAVTGKIAPTSAFEQEAAPVNRPLAVGSRVRVTRGEFIGAISNIESYPDQPQATATGIITPGAYLTLDGALHYIPFANLAQVR